MTTSSVKAYTKFFERNIDVLDEWFDQTNGIDFLSHDVFGFRTLNKDPMIGDAKIMTPICRNIHKSYNKAAPEESMIHYFYDIVLRNESKYGMQKNDKNKFYKVHPIHFSFKDNHHRMWIYDSEREKNDYPLPRNYDDLMKFMTFISFLIRSIFKTQCRDHSTLLDGHDIYLNKYRFLYLLTSSGILISLNIFTSMLHGSKCS